MITDARKRRMLVAFGCGAAFALTHGIAKQIVLGAILLSGLLAIALTGLRLWQMNQSLRGTIKQLETGNPPSGPLSGGLFPPVSNGALAVKWAGALLVSAAIATIDPQYKILGGILLAIIVGLLIDGILLLRVRVTGRRLKGYATMLSRFVGNAAAPRL